MAPYLEKYTGARTLIQNSKVIQAQNTLYRSKPDGLTVILCGHGPKEITAQLFKQEGASFDWTKFTLLGQNPRQFNGLCRRQKTGLEKTGRPSGEGVFRRRQQSLLRTVVCRSVGLG